MNEKHPQDAAPFLEVKHLTVEYFTKEQVVHAVNDVSFHLEKGRTLGLVRETGAGKTSIAKAILRMLPDVGARIAGGQVLLEGTDITALSEYDMRQIRGDKITMIFQDPMTALNPVQRVGDQIAEVVALHSKGSKEDCENRAKEMLEMVGIPAERYREYPHQFSGGMKQRVVIAMALACNPDLLIADEPTTALDVTIQAQVLDMMKKLREQNGTSMLMITHDLGIVAEVCDCVSVIYAGRVVEHGTLEDVFDHTLHPYTKGLFNSLPNMKGRKARLQPIPGLMPDPSRLPEGCAFADRCRYATDRCFHERPEVLHRTEEHTVACHLYTPENIQKGGVLDHE